MLSLAQTAVALPKNSYSPAAHFFLDAPVQYIQLEDATMALRHFGQGPALLFIHGFPLSGFTWRHILVGLSKHFTCYVPDLAGLGDSTWHTHTDFHFLAHTKRLKAMMDILKIAEYSIIAQDSGATTARCLTLQDQQRVQKLVMINTEISFHRPPWIVEYQRLTKIVGVPFIFQQLLRSQTFLKSSLGFGGSFQDLALLNDEFLQQSVKPLADKTRLKGLISYLNGIDWKLVDDMAVQHKNIHQPVLLLWGENDPTFPLSYAKKMLREFADAKLSVIADSKLLPHEEKPAEVLAALTGFLQPQQNKTL